MQEHYEAVLQDMENQERKLEAQLTKIRAARPAILALMEDASPKPMQSAALFGTQKYAVMRAKEAVLDVLGDATHPLSSQEIAAKLQAGGIRTQSSDFVSVIKSTLAALKKEPAQVERREEGWVAIKTVSSSWDSIVPQQPLQQ